MASANGSSWWTNSEFKAWRMAEIAPFLSYEGSLAYFIVSPDGTQCALIRNDDIVVILETSEAFQQSLARSAAGGEFDTAESAECHCQESEHGVDPTWPHLWISPDGNRVALGYRNYGKPTLFLDNQETELDDEITDVWFSPDSRHVILVFDGDDETPSYYKIDGARYNGKFECGAFTHDSLHHVAVVTDDEYSRYTLFVDGKRVIEFKRPQKWRVLGTNIDDESEPSTADFNYFEITEDSKFVLFGYVTLDEAQRPMSAVAVYSIAERRILETFPKTRILHVFEKAEAGTMFAFLGVREDAEVPHPTVMEITRSIAQ